jgi:hypothetical protein
MQGAGAPSRRVERFASTAGEGAMHRDALVRRFDATGTPTSAVAFRANTPTEFTPHAPHVAAHRSGDLVVVWTGHDAETEDGYFYGGYGVRAQRVHLAPPPPCPPAPRTGCRQPTIPPKRRLMLKDEGVVVDRRLLERLLRVEGVLANDAEQFSGKAHAG